VSCSGSGLTGVGGTLDEGVAEGTDALDSTGLVESCGLAPFDSKTKLRLKSCRDWSILFLSSGPVSTLWPPLTLSGTKADGGDVPVCPIC
jgi:hypothetical protein